MVAFVCTTSLLYYEDASWSARSGQRLGDDVDGEVLFGGATVGAAGGRHVVVVAAEGDLDMVLARYQVVGRVEAPPPVRGRERLDPGVGCPLAAAGHVGRCRRSRGLRLGLRLALAPADALRLGLRLRLASTAGAADDVTADVARGDAD